MDNDKSIIMYHGGYTAPSDVVSIFHEAEVRSRTRSREDASLRISLKMGNGLLL